MRRQVMALHTHWCLLHPYSACAAEGACCVALRWNDVYAARIYADSSATVDVIVASKHLECSCRVALQHLPAITVRGGLVCEGGRPGSVLSPAVVQQLLLLSSCLMARLALIPA
jgi:hypothetical protein